MASSSKPFEQETPDKSQRNGVFRILSNPVTTVVFSVVLMVEGVALHFLAPQMSPIYIGDPRWAKVLSLALDPLALSVMGLAFLVFAFAVRRHSVAPEQAGLIEAFPAILSGFLALLAAISSIPCI